MIYLSSIVVAVVATKGKRVHVDVRVSCLLVSWLLCIFGDVFPTGRHVVGHAVPGFHVCIPPAGITP